MRSARAQNMPVRTHSPTAGVVDDYASMVDVVMEACR